MDDIFDEPPYSITKRLLMLVGVWPLQSRRQRRTRISLVLFCFLGMLLPLAILQMSYGTISDMIRLVSWTMGQHIHLFFLHLPGQRLLNFSMQVYYDALDCIWYDYFKKAQVVYQILIMRTMEPVKLTALKVRPLNMEAFLAVTQAAVSYFTVLSSTT